MAAGYTVRAMSIRGLSLVALLAAGCAVGAPPGFSDGDLWTVPLVAPLEDDLLLVPVYVQDKKEPLLFMVDPDSRVSAIDAALQSELGPHTVLGRDEINEADNAVKIWIAEIQKIKVGDLEVRNLKMRVLPAGSIGAGGRIVRGILGGDVISESLVFAADRNRGVAYLATQGNLAPPPEATEVKFRSFFGRRLAEVTVNGQRFDMHLDLGARTSMLWEPRMKKAGLEPQPVRAVLVDEYATKREVSAGGIARTTELAGTRAEGLLFLPFGDRRLDPEEVDGALGMNFLARFHLTMNWHKKRLWLKPRSEDVIGTATERIGRWGGVFAGCDSVACVRAELVREEVAAPAAAAEPAPAAAAEDPAPAAAAEEPAAATAPAPIGAGAARMISITREGLGDISYEVLLEAVDADGAPLGLPRLLVTLRAGESGVTEVALAPRYTPAAALVVVDVSPFPRLCDEGPGGTRCVWPVGPNP